MATDLTRRHPSRHLFADGFMLTDREVDWFQHQYAATADRTDPRLSPLLADPGPTPATVWTAGFDPRRDEGEAYAHKLNATLHREPDLVHGYLSFYPLSRRFRTAALAVAAEIRATLAKPA
ncbi:alpha/beta hydrolase fold domain-containing protein [Actinoplanes sp. NPDC089786]|uniref:alpha/beta hydrolase fold domain-containing protein n=1 Tax=Actinoplanes sp. NPDC089786 TaxID=3155185 RepID=UPI003420075A